MQDFHTHSTFCDGEDSLEDMVLAALDKGMDALGFSEHGHTVFDDTYCLSRRATELYCSQVEDLKRKYVGRIRILCGIERDYYSTDPLGGFDYTIGSVHYLKTAEGYFPLDDSPNDLKRLAARYFEGDMYALVEEYYRCVADVVRATDADVIGHFDLIAKFNQRSRLFDESSDRYRQACFDAIDALIPFDRPFEINTAALFKGYRTQPYPSLQLLRFIGKRGGKVILSSDSHCAESLCYQFEYWEAVARSFGLTVCSFIDCFE